jgi:hypothetical protein
MTLLDVRAAAERRADAHERFGRRFGLFTEKAGKESLGPCMLILADRKRGPGS